MLLGGERKLGNPEEQKENIKIIRRSETRLRRKEPRTLDLLDTTRTSYTTMLYLYIIFFFLDCTHWQVEQ